LCDLGEIDPAVKEETDGADDGDDDKDKRGRSVAGEIREVAR
jgi:hypothetical protein